MAKECSLEGCSRRLMAKGLCSYHYALSRRTVQGPFPKDLTGITFGRLTALRPKKARPRSNGAGSLLWLCRCECGTVKFIARSSLIKGLALSCGCLRFKGRQGRKYEPHPRQRLRLVGQRYGRLVVLKDHEGPPIKGLTPSGRISYTYRVECICDCGTRCTVNRQGLRAGSTQSCGCLARDVRRARLRDTVYKRFTTCPPSGSNEALPLHQSG